MLATIIITDAKPQDSNFHNLILIIGGLHTERSFLSYIGYIIIAPRVQQLLEVIYAPNAVMHIMSGKAIFRTRREHLIVDSALQTRREHLIVDSALQTILASHALGLPIPSQEVYTMELETLELMDATEEEVADISGIIDEPSELNEASVIFEKLFSGELCVDVACSKKSIANLY